MGGHISTLGLLHFLWRSLLCEPATSPQTILGVHRARFFRISRLSEPCITLASGCLLSAVVLLTLLSLWLRFQGAIQESALPLFRVAQGTHALRTIFWGRTSLWAWFQRAIKEFALPLVGVAQRTGAIAVTGRRPVFRRRSVPLWAWFQFGLTDPLGFVRNIVRVVVVGSMNRFSLPLIYPVGNLLSKSCQEVFRLVSPTGRHESTGHAEFCRTVDVS
mmetsp:Transcript_2694/g.6166  ORF Transcript_2694/g.6166 Transcript_2694/m.6166 type:complete len:218 (+) Transcript_2694:269-922(+)